jgi:3D (Asp-Asp-Asp) domain-containing protein
VSKGSIVNQNVLRCLFSGVALIGGLSACASHNKSQPSALPPQKINGLSLQSLGQVEPTFYWISIEPNDGQPKTQDVLDESGNLINQVSVGYMATLRMEGTGKLLDGRVINFKSKITHPDGTTEIRYRVCGPSAPYGYGYQDIPLVPYRSVAVDPNIIPIGSTIFVPAAKGVVLPDGTIHDGLFQAVDVGDLIVALHIDFFTAFGDNSAIFEQNGLISGQKTEMFLVK